MNTSTAIDELMTKINDEKTKINNTPKFNKMALLSLLNYISKQTFEDNDGGKKPNIEDETTLKNTIESWLTLIYNSSKTIRNQLNYLNDIETKFYDTLKSFRDFQIGPEISDEFSQVLSDEIARIQDSLEDGAYLTPGAYFNHFPEELHDNPNKIMRMVRYLVYLAKIINPDGYKSVILSRFNEIVERFYFAYITDTLNKVPPERNYNASSIIDMLYYIEILENFIKNNGGDIEVVFENYVPYTPEENEEDTPEENEEDTPEENPK